MEKKKKSAVAKFFNRLKNINAVESNIFMFHVFYLKLNLVIFFLFKLNNILILKARIYIFNKF